MSAEKHYLAYRDKKGLRKIEVFEDEDEAYSKYSFADYLCMRNDPAGLERCLAEYEQALANEDLEKEWP